MTPLRQAMIDQCRLRGLSPRTEETYLYAVEQISRYYQQRPDYLTEAQLEAYFTYLTLEKKASRNTIHIQLNGIHFFFEHVLHRSFTITKPLPKRAHKLPTLLSVAEVRQIITCCEDPKYQTMLWVYYGTGLHFGWLSNKSRKEKLALIKAQEPKAATLRKKPEATTEPIWHCPHCKGGVLQLAVLLKRLDTGPPDS